MAAFSIFFSENDFEAALVILCSYDYGANASETVDKIAIDQKDYQKCTLCCIATVEKVGF